jgi:SHAQKYF class myb-like DNA-binding protein
LSSGGGRHSTGTAIPARVVETGHEHTGRWTKEEHESFLSALKNYGKEWKKVAAKVKTRTVVQTRTHAQKYFQKLSKAMESKDDITDVHMGVAAEAKRGAASAQKKKPRIASASASSSLSLHLTVAAAAAAKPARQTSVTSAAHLISNLSSSTTAEVVGATSSATGAFHLPGAAASVAASSGFAKPQVPSSLSSGGGHHKSSLFPAQHGFSTFSSSTPSSEHTTFATPFSSSGGGGSSFIGSKSSTAGGVGTTKAFSSIKIVAPEHDVAMKRGKFPEPSPAACGKRKLAEIAAARMLAGVLSVGRSAAVMDDGTATPPEEEETAAANNSKTSMGGVEMKSIPAPPPIAGVDKIHNNGSSGSSSLVGRKGMGLSLQIVNPETLGVSYEDQQKRRRDGQGSPVTPWEGQLKALVRYVSFALYVGTVMNVDFLQFWISSVRIKRRPHKTRTALTSPGLLRLWMDLVAAARAHTLFADQEQCTIEIPSTKQFARWTWQ